MFERQIFKGIKPFEHESNDLTNECHVNFRHLVVNTKTKVRYHCLHKQNYSHRFFIVTHQFLLSLRHRFRFSHDEIESPTAPVLHGLPLATRIAEVVAMSR